MPQIPMGQRQVRQQVFQSSGVSARDTVSGGTPGASEALAGLVNNSVNVYDKMIAQAEEVELSAFEQQIRDEQVKLTTDKNVGFYNAVKGKDTTAKYDEYEGSFSKFTEDKIAGLGSERAKTKAKLLADKYKGDFVGQLNNHTSREMEKYDDNQTEANLASIRNYAVVNYKEMALPGADGSRTSKVRKSLEDQNLQIDQYAARKGLGKEQIEQMKLTKASELHYGVISQALNNGEDLLAKDYYKEARAAGEIDADTALKLDKIVESSSIKGESQRLSDSLSNKYQDLGSQLDEARKIKDPDLRDATVARVRDRWNEDKLVKTEQDRVGFENVINELEKYKTIDHLPEEEKLKISGKKAAALKSLMGYISRGQEPNTDPEIYQDLMLMASRPEMKAKFLQTDINESAHKLSNADRKKLLDMQKAVRTGSGKFDNDFGQFLSDSQTIDGTLTEIGVTDKAKKAKFQRLVQERAIQWQRENGKKNIPQDELRKISDKLATEVTVKGTFWDSKKSLFEVADNEQIVMPESFAEDIKRRYAAKGLQYSPEKARTLYLKQINRNK